MADSLQNLQDARNWITLKIGNVTKEMIDNIHEECRRRFIQILSRGRWVAI